MKVHTSTIVNVEMTYIMITDRKKKENREDYIVK